MITKRLARLLWVTALALAASPAIALAEEAAEETAVDPTAAAAKAIGAALAIGLAAVGAGYAQGKIGAAGAGTLAERPEAFTNVLILEALPEIIALLGFVTAFLILG
jgi:V/A-type H+-transporting ATPase subunit K